MSLKIKKKNLDALNSHDWSQSPCTMKSIFQGKAFQIHREEVPISEKRWEGGCSVSPSPLEDNRWLIGKFDLQAQLTAHGLNIATQC